MSTELSDVEFIPPYKPALTASQEMILQIALGMEHPEEIAARYGIEGDEWKKLSEYRPFQIAIDKQRAELEASGLTFRVKAKALTEDVFEEAYKIARSNDATLMQKLEFIKLGAKLADMEPKASAQVASGPGFSISINFSTPKPENKVIDITPKELETDEPSKL